MGPSFWRFMAWQIKRLGDDVQTPLYDDLFAARRYRLEAKRCRAISESMRSDEARKSMREIARYYEKLANRHERRPIALALIDTITSDWAAVPNVHTP